jgi:thioredoxin 1
MKTAKYFSATWCGPCKAFKPIVQEVVSEGYNIEYIDIDSNQDTAVEYGVRSVPTVVILQNGTEVDRLVGSVPKQVLLDKLN